MFYIGIINYMIHYIYALRQFIAVIKSLNMFKNLEYTDFQINIINPFHELRNGKHPSDITLVIENNIQVKHTK